jgi:hypothetical protein
MSFPSEHDASTGFLKKFRDCLERRRRQPCSLAPHLHATRQMQPVQRRASAPTSKLAGPINPPDRWRHARFYLGRFRWSLLFVDCFSSPNASSGSFLDWVTLVWSMYGWSGILSSVATRVVLKELPTELRLRLRLQSLRQAFDDKKHSERTQLRSG